MDYKNGGKLIPFPLCSLVPFGLSSYVFVRLRLMWDIQMYPVIVALVFGQDPNIQLLSLVLIYIFTNNVTSINVSYIKEMWYENQELSELQKELNFDCFLEFGSVNSGKLMSHQRSLVYPEMSDVLRQDTFVSSCKRSLLFIRNFSAYFPHLW